MVEHHHALGAALRFDQLDHFRVVDAADFVLVVEVTHFCRVADEAEAVAVEHEAIRFQTAVMHFHRTRIVAAALALVVARPARRYR